MAPRIINDKNKVLILQRILAVKGLLFGDDHTIEEKNAEWKKIASYASNGLGIKRDFKFFKGPFWYSCKTSVARKLLNKKKMPLTRAHMLIMDILGKDSLKYLHNGKEKEAEEDLSMSDNETSFPSISMKEEEVASPPHGFNKRVSDESDEEKEFRSMKKRKLAIEIEHAQLLLDKEKGFEKQIA